MCAKYSNGIFIRIAFRVEGFRSGYDPATPPLGPSSSLSLSFSLAYIASNLHRIGSTRVNDNGFSRKKFFSPIEARFLGGGGIKRTRDL